MLGKTAFMLKPLEARRKTTVGAAAAGGLVIEKVKKVEDSEENNFSFFFFLRSYFIDRHTKYGPRALQTESWWNQ